MSPAKTTKKQSNQGFKPGQSGNPSGRPHGSRNKATLALEALLDGEGEAITRKAIENALNGDMAAIRLYMERLIPVRKDRTVSFSLPEINGADDGQKQWQECFVRWQMVTLLQVKQAALRE